MKKIKIIKKRILSIVLSCTMMVSLLMGMPPMEVKAANFYPPVIDKDSITLYESGCLKAITITVQASKYYAPAYGRIGVHNATTPYNWDKRFISTGCTSWPDESVFKAKDSTFLTFANGEQFLWTDGKTHTVTVTFDNGDVDLSQTGTYYIYLWTISDQYGIYTDALIGTLGTEGGVLKDSNGNTLIDSSSSHTHVIIPVPAEAATCTADGNKAYYKCETEDCDCVFEDAEGNVPTTLEDVKIDRLGHDLSEATCTEASECQREDCDYIGKTALGHDWSGEWTIVKEATEKEDGKKETLCTRGCGQKKVVSIPATGTTDDNAHLEKDTEIEPNAPVDEATLNNSKEELLEAGNIFTDAEKTQIANGANARVWLEISKTDESAIAPTDKAKIEQEAAKIMDNNPLIAYFDVDLFKQVGTGDKQEITEPAIGMKITITIPNELLNSNKLVLREYKIIRLHDGQVDVINGTFDAETSEFSFETDKFSTYAIVYKDVPVNDDGDSVTPGEDDDPATPGEDDDPATPGEDDDPATPGEDDDPATPGEDDDPATPGEDEDPATPGEDEDPATPGDDDDKEDEVPKTGDSNVTLYAFVLMLLSGLGLIICSRKKNILNKES